jgi:acetyl-CoA acetyltransferase
MMRVESTGAGLSAVVLACRLLRTEEVRSVLVVAGDIMRDGPQFLYDPEELDAVLSDSARSLRLDRHVVMSAITELFLAKHELSNDEFHDFRRRIVEHETGNASRSRHSYSSRRGAYPFSSDSYDSVEKYFGTTERRQEDGRRINRWETSSLTTYDICPACNGAGALLLSNAPTFGYSRKPLSVIQGYGSAADSVEVLDRPEPHRFRATSEAMKMASHMAGRSTRSLRKALEAGSLLLETQTHVSPLAAVNLIDLGFVEKFEEIGNRVLPNVNRSGGVWSGHPLDGGNIIRMVDGIECILEGDAETVVCHSVGGPGSSAAVVILGAAGSKIHLAKIKKLSVPSEIAGRLTDIRGHDPRLLCLIRFERIVSTTDSSEADLIRYGFTDKSLWLNGYSPDDLRRLKGPAPDGSQLGDGETRVFAVGVVAHRSKRYWALAADENAVALSPEDVRRERPRVILASLTNAPNEQRQVFYPLDK